MKNRKTLFGRTIQKPEALQRKGWELCNSVGREVVDQTVKDILTETPGKTILVSQHYDSFLIWRK